MKKGLIILAVSLLCLFIGYKVLSSISSGPIDKSVNLTAPISDKSKTEHYAFGYQPALNYTEERQPCREQYPYKRAFWGDFHIHTALSADAFPDGTRSFPDDVYRFAQGEEIALPTAGSEAQSRIRLARPLDFASVTDHAETFGEGYICRTQGAFSGYESKACEKFRAGGEAGVRVFMSQNAKLSPKRRSEVCADDGSDCAKADKIVWQSVINAAQAAYDRSPDCKFTSFIGYEYTSSPNSMHMHRNNIFRNADVPDVVPTHISHPQAYDLLRALEDDCRAGRKGCDVLSIPHNSNISGGNAFNPRALEGFSVESQQAFRAYRQAYDRLMEITQHKGSSECLNGATDVLGDVDELCDVEAIRAFGQAEQAIRLNSYLPSLTDTNSPECDDTSFDKSHNLYKGFCLSSRDFARGALLEGLHEEQASQINPYEFGFIGSSDTHIGTAGQVEEDEWAGHIAYETDLEGRLGVADLGRFNRLVSNPGGLAGVYAVENSRDALFQSMKRREAFGTSGPRIEPRFFIGNYEAGICQNPDWLELAYQNGTPMGSKLAPLKSAPQFIVQGKQDALSNPLQRLQIIKGWLGVDGKKYSEVIELENQAEGKAELCQLYTDKTYDPSLPTYYYARIVEMASTRWSTLACLAIDATKRPQACANEQAETIFEMAWSSPIWLTPISQNALPTPQTPHLH